MVSIKNRLTKKQMEMLVSFMEDHTLFARGQITHLGRNGKYKYLQMWNDLSKQLNENVESKKNPEEWMKTWTNLRRKSKQNYATFLKAFSKTGNQSPTFELDQIDERIAKIFGKYGSGISIHESIVPNIPSINETSGLRKRGNQQQMQVLYNFMEKNISFARSELSNKAINMMWNILKQKLDEVDGEKRSIDAWKKTWRECKLRTVKRNKTVGFDKLSSTQKRIFKIIDPVKCEDQCGSTISKSFHERKEEALKKIQLPFPNLPSTSSSGLSIAEMGLLLGVVNEERKEKKELSTCINLTSDDDDDWESFNDFEIESPKESLKRCSTEKAEEKRDLFSNQTSAKKPRKAESPYIEKIISEQSHSNNLVTTIADSLKDISKTLTNINETLNKNKVCSVCNCVKSPLVSTSPPDEINAILKPLENTYTLRPL